MLDRQREKVNVTVHARTTHDGWQPAKRSEEDLCCSVTQSPPPSTHTSPTDDPVGQGTELNSVRRGSIPYQRGFCVHGLRLGWWKIHEEGGASEGAEYTRKPHAGRRAFYCLQSPTNHHHHRVIRRSVTIQTIASGQAVIARRAGEDLLGLRAFL